MFGDHGCVTTAPADTTGGRRGSPLRLCSRGGAREVRILYRYEVFLQAQHPIQASEHLKKLSCASYPPAIQERWSWFAPISPRRGTKSAPPRNRTIVDELPRPYTTHPERVSVTTSRPY